MVKTGHQLLIGNVNDSKNNYKLVWTLIKVYEDLEEEEYRAMRAIDAPMK